MLNPRSIRQFCAARAWLQQFPKIRTFNHPETSYGLKRVAEPTIGYVTNGIFICAALAAGYRIEREPGSSNVVFRYSTKGVAAVIKPSELTIIKGPTAAERSRLALRIACDAARGGRTALYLLSKTRTQIETILGRALGPPDGWPLSLEIYQALPPMDRGGFDVVSTWLRAYPTAAMVVIDPATVTDLTKRRGIAAELKGSGVGDQRHDHHGADAVIGRSGRVWCPL